MSRLSVIGVDADDTLWHHEQFFQDTQRRFAELLAEHGEARVIEERLWEVERRNLSFYGFGTKSFTLSLIETAIEVTGGRLRTEAVSEILAWGRDMLRHPVETLPGAREALDALSATHRLVLITKGDLFDQERKLAASGLGDFFHAVEIVSDKRPDTYARLFARHGSGAEHALMVGNSIKSDVIPAIEAGAWGVHVPHQVNWVLDHADAPEGHGRFRVIETLGELPVLVRGIEEPGEPPDVTLA